MTKFIMEFKSCENYIRSRCRNEKEFDFIKKNCFGSNILEFGMLRYN